MPPSRTSSYSATSLFLSSAHTIVTNIFTPDAAQLAAVVTVEKLSLTKIFTFSSPIRKSQGDTNDNKSQIVTLLEKLLVHHKISKFSADDVAIKSIGDEDFSKRAFSDTVGGICNWLLRVSNDPSPDFASVTFVPLYVHYYPLDLPQSLLSLLQSLHRTSTKAATAHEALRPQIKHQARVLEAECDKIRRELNGPGRMTLGESWKLRRELEIREALFDNARLQCIPTLSRIKFVGTGIKVGVSAVWIEDVLCPFQFESRRDKNDLPKVFVRIGQSKKNQKKPDREESSSSNGEGGGGGSSNSSGVISFLAENLYLRAEAMPRIKLKSFKGKCR